MTHPATESVDAPPPKAPFLRRVWPILVLTFVYSMFVEIIHVRSPAELKGWIEFVDPVLSILRFVVPLIERLEENMLASASAYRTAITVHIALVYWTALYGVAALGLWRVCFGRGLVGLTDDPGTPKERPMGIQESMPLDGVLLAYSPLILGLFFFLWWGSIDNAGQSSLGRGLSGFGRHAIGTFMVGFFFVIAAKAIDLATIAAAILVRRRQARRRRISP